MTVRKYISKLSYPRVIRLALFILFWFILADVLLWAAPGVFFPKELRRNPVFSSAYTEWCLAHLPKNVDYPRVFFLGDSTGQGINMRTRYILPPQLETALRKYPGLENVEVVNLSEVAGGPADKLLLLTAFADYSADLFVLQLSHRMFSNATELFSRLPSLYPAVAIEVTRLHREAGLDELAPQSFFRRAPLRSSHLLKRCWRLYASGNMYRFWLDSDAGRDFLGRLGGKETKKHRNWIHRKNAGGHNIGDIFYLMKYLSDKYMHVSEEREQIEYLRKMVRFVKEKKPPVFWYVSYANADFIRYAAELIKRDPRHEGEKIRDAHEIIKSVLREEGVEDVTDFLEFVLSEETIDMDHLMPKGNERVAEELARKVAPLMKRKR
ncbi:MAG: hypothetical protein E3J72_14380 [Planctomycetota bacterium]|nr:MAG: hypothetical protein E3J72_14380 [Planctomycetota bacterium]